MKAIRCQCGCIYPDDMNECPSCQCATQNNRNHVLTETKDLGTKNTKPSEWKPIHVASSNPKLTTSKTYNKQNNPKLTPCVACNNQISIQAESCPYCGQPTGIHVCPKCNSANTKVISGASKATSIFLWGPFAANKVVSKFQCKDCGHKW